MASLWKMPPRAKVYEALSALADERVRLTSDRGAEVTSSAGDKVYTIEWSEDGRQISSNDNASFYQGYIGYPIIAVLLKLGRISFRQEIAQHLAAIPWKRLNTKHKRDYDKAVEDALSGLSADAVRSDLEKEVDNIFASLPGLKLERGGGRTRPPLGR